MSKDKTIRKRPILIFLMFIFVCNIHGQCIIPAVTKSSCHVLEIIRDTLWFGQKGWKLAEYLPRENNPIFSIGSIEDAKDFDFALIPFLKVSPKGFYYVFGEDLLNYLEYDSTLISAVVLFHNKQVGYISGFKHKSKWLSYPFEILNNDSKTAHAIKTLTEEKPDMIFCLKGIVGYFFILKNGKIFCFYNDKIVPVEEFIKEYVGESTVRSFSKLP